MKTVSDQFYLDVRLDLNTLPTPHGCLDWLGFKFDSYLFERTGTIPGKWCFTKRYKPSSIHELTHYQVNYSDLDRYIKVLFDAKTKSVCPIAEREFSFAFTNRFVPEFPKEAMFVWNSLHANYVGERLEKRLINQSASRPLECALRFDRLVWFFPYENIRVGIELSWPDFDVDGTLLGYNGVYLFVMRGNQRYDKPTTGFDRLPPKAILCDRNGLQFNDTRDEFVFIHEYLS